MPNNIVLRPYQQDAVDKALIYSTTKQKFLGFADAFWVCFATGGGKTLTGVSIALQNIDNGVLWICHREELKQQAIDAFLNFIPISKIHVIDANSDEHPCPGKVCIAMVQTAIRREISVSSRMQIVVDEAHHIEAPSYRFIHNKPRSKPVICLSATPPTFVYDYSEEQKAEADLNFLIANKYLSPFKYHRVTTGFKYNHYIRKDFTTKSLNLLNDPQRHKVIKKTLDDNRDLYKKTIMYFGLTEDATAMYNLLKKSYKDCWLITGKTPKEERQKSIKEYKNSKDGIMINVSVFVEGFDEPTINTVFLCRPTTSKILFMQMIGRGARLSNNKKEFYIVDFVDAVKRHMFASDSFASDILGLPEYTNKTLSVTEIMKAVIAKGIEENIALAGVKRSTFLRVDKESIVGALSYYKYKANKASTVVLTKEDAIAIWALFGEIQDVYNNNSVPIHNKIKESWALLGCFTNYDSKEWTSICWSIYYDIKTNLNTVAIDKFSNRFNVIFLDDSLKPSQDELVDYKTLTKPNVKELKELDAKYKDKALKLSNEIVANLRNQDRKLADAVMTNRTQQVMYSNRVLTIYMKPKCFKISRVRSVYAPSLQNIKSWREALTSSLQDVTNDDYISVKLLCNQQGN